MFLEPTSKVWGLEAKKAKLLLEVWKINGYSNKDTHFSWKAEINLFSKTVNSDNFAKLETKKSENHLYEETVVKTDK